MSRSRVPLLAVATLAVGLVLGNSLMSRAGSEQLVNVVYIATGANFPDALGVGQASEAGPILLVQPNSIPESTADELIRLNPKKIVIVGGPAVVSASVEADLDDYTSGAVIRIAGDNRFDTAAALSADQYPVTGSFTCPGLGFLPSSSLTAATEWGTTGFHRYGDGAFRCVTDLPDGVTITRVQLAAYDDDDTENLSCELNRIDIEGGTANSGQGNVETLASVATVGLPQSVEVTELSVSHPVVDTDRYGYWLDCSLHGSNTRIIGMRISYRH